MSDSLKTTTRPKRIGEGYSPARLTPDEFRQLSEIFKAWIDSSNLKWWIIAAGIGAILEGLHIIWLALRYILRF
jgi:hypothetical protein